MLYLSRLLLDTQARMVQRDLANCHHLHRRILRAFPAKPAEAHARDHFGVLYRLEPMDADVSLLRLLVQSAAQPDWSELPERYVGMAPDGQPNPAVRRIDAEYARIQQGMRLRFRLRANPTRRVSAKHPNEPAQWHGKRVDLVREEDQLAWLRRKGEQAGFALVQVGGQADLDEVHAAPQAKQRGWRRVTQAEPAARLTFGSVVFDGMLDVTDLAAFQHALRTGIGSGKAFGFGLLSVASLAAGH